MTIYTVLFTDSEIAALATVACWTLSCLTSEYVAKRASSLAINVLRMYMAFTFFAVFSFFIRCKAIPLDASSDNWIWLGLSGVIGFVVGDLFLLKSFSIIGSRTSMLIMALVPPLTAVIGFLVLGETLALRHIMGMVLTTSGVSAVILVGENGSKQFKHPVKGIFYASIGALGQAIGLILTKYGVGEFNAFAATHIRIVGGLLGFTILALHIRPWQQIKYLISQPKLMGFIAASTFCGTFIGIYLSLVSVKYTTTGIASTIMSIVPITIIPFSVYAFKEKVTVREIAGAIAAVAGTCIMFS